jgi:heme-degrading monooxygenase HmoA
VFAQIIRGKVNDPSAVRPVVDRWMKELGPTANGWLGSTSGITDDNELFVLVRFESEEAARANSDKPEQGAWWADMEKVFDGEPTFRDSNNVIVPSAGAPDTAGFVQVMSGQSSDPDRSAQLMDSSRDARVAHRPDILGSITVVHGEGKFTMVIYFESEEAARKGESKPLPAELQAQMQEMMSLSVGQPEFLDLKAPWLDSPK